MKEITAIKKVLIDKVKPGTRGYLGHAFGFRFTEIGDNPIEVSIVCGDQEAAAAVFSHLSDDFEIDKEKIYEVAVMKAENVS